MDKVNIVTYLWPYKWQYIATKKHKTDGVLYTEEYVEKLHNSITRNLSYPHEFHHFDKNNFMDPFPGWFQLMSFMQLPFPFMFFSLDTVITGSLDEVVDFAREKNKLTVCRDVVPESLLPNMNMAWIQDCQYLYKKFKEIYGDGSLFTNDRNDYSKQPVYHDEDFLEKYGSYEFFPDKWRISYKIGLRDNEAPLKPDLKIINFHGYPKPHQVEDRRIEKHWR